MPSIQKPSYLTVPLGLHPHQSAWALALAQEMGGITPQIAVLRAFKAYVRMWQAGQLPPDLTPGACAAHPPSLPDAAHAP